MGIFNRREEIKERAESQTMQDTVTVGDSILEALLSEEYLTLGRAMNVPTFAGCVNKICDTVSMIPIYLYKKEDDSVSQVDDPRVDMLNKNTNDTMTGADFKKAMVYDYLTAKGGYAYIDRSGNETKAIRYVEPQYITFSYTIDPIFKRYKIDVEGKEYDDYQFIKFLRRTKNGYCGTSIVDENKEVLMTAYKSLIFERDNARKGGAKKGYLESEHTVAEEVLQKLKEAFAKLYKSNNENVIVLNNGIKFKEMSETSVEMQLNENKKANGVEICKLLGMPPNILSGSATEQDKLQYIQYCIAPILETFCQSLNRDLLLESEKRSMYFAADMTEFTKGDIKTRYEAYSTAYKNGFLQVDDIRRRENLPSLNMPFIKMGLQDVLYNPETGAIFTPNMGKGYNIKDAMEGTGQFDEEGAPAGKPSDVKPTSESEEPKEDPGKEKTDEDNNKS